VAVPLTLKVFKGDELIATKDYDRDIIKIGRLSSAHLCLDDERVSRIHSVIEVSPEGALSIIDMGSVEGTYVNGKRVNKGAIAFGDVVKVGNTTIRVENATDAAAASIASATAKADVVKSPDSEAAITSEAARVETEPVMLQAAESRATQTVRASAVAAPPLEAAVDEPAVPEIPRHMRKKTGALGLELRFFWGIQRVGEFFLKPKKPQTFTVGTAKGVDFILAEPKLGAESFELVKTDGESFNVRFPGKIKGSLLRGENKTDLETLVESGKVQRDDAAYTFMLGKTDVLTLELGGVTVVLTLEPAPKPVWVPWQESVDFAALNIFLVMFFLAAVFVIAAVNREAAGDQWADDLNADSRIVRLVIKPPETIKNPFLDRLAENKLKEKAKPAERYMGNEGQAGMKDSKDHDKRMAPKGKPDSKDQARQMMARIMGSGKSGGLSTLLGNGIGGELRSMMGNLTGRVAGDSNGMSGLGLRGSASGGGAMGNTIGIAGVGTRFGGDRGGADRVGQAIMGEKKKTDIAIKSDEAQILGSIDPELIRRVIHSHRDQIRYCYEMELVRQPKLGGKIKVKFVIGSNGFVTTTGIAESSVHNSTLENCIAARVKSWEFPKPKGGGVAIVSYPFVFKQSGD